MKANGMGQGDEGLEFDYLSLEQLRRQERQVDAYPPDAIPARVDEMAFPPAEPVRQVLLEALSRDKVVRRSAPMAWSR